MNKVINYSVIVGEDKQELVRLVNSWLTDGWQPLGGVSGYSEDVFCGQRSRYVQAMVKYENHVDAT